MRLLVLDDRRVNQKLLSRYLSGRGFEVLTAGSVEEAQAVMAQAPVEAVLAEVFLPGQDALAFVQALKAAGGPRVIAVSSHVLPEQRAEALAAGCVAFIPQPVELAELLRVVHHHLPPSGSGS